MTNVAEITDVLEEVRISSPKYYLSSSSPPTKKLTKKLTPTLLDVLEFAKVPFDEDALKISFKKHSFKLSARKKQANQIALVYKKDGKEIEENNPSAIIAAVVGQELPEAGPTTGRGYNSISYRGRTLFSFKKELITSNIIKDLLKHNGVRSAYAVNRKGEKVKFVVETPLPLDEFFNLKGNEVLRNDESVQVQQVIGSFREQRFPGNELVVPMSPADSTKVERGTLGCYCSSIDGKHYAITANHVIPYNFDKSAALLCGDIKLYLECRFAGDAALLSVQEGVRTHCHIPNIKCNYEEEDSESEQDEDSNEDEDVNNEDEKNAYNPTSIAWDFIHEGDIVFKKGFTSGLTVGKIKTVFDHENVHDNTVVTQEFPKAAYYSKIAQCYLGEQEYEKAIKKFEKAKSIIAAGPHLPMHVRPLEFAILHAKLLWNNNANDLTKLLELKNELQDHPFEYQALQWCLEHIEDKATEERMKVLDEVFTFVKVAWINGLPDFSKGGDSGSLYFVEKEGHVIPIAIHKSGDAANRTSTGIRIDCVFTHFRNVMKNEGISFCTPDCAS